MKNVNLSRRPCRDFSLSLVLDRAPEEGSAREAGDGAVVDMLSGRLPAHLALLRRGDQRVRRRRRRFAVGDGAVRLRVACVHVSAAGVHSVISAAVSCIMSWHFNVDGPHRFSFAAMCINPCWISSMIRVL